MTPTTTLTTTPETERLDDRLDDRFRRLLEERRRALPDVDRRLATLDAAAAALAQLDEAVGTLGEARTIPAELVDQLRAVDLAGLQGQVGATVAGLRALRARLARDTVNIGVGGPAGVGKSTLLQSISGLGDDQIPTAGGGLPVTAVRSRIYHAEALAEARLTMHTFESFRSEVLAPFHRKLELADVPTSLAAYRSFAYPRSVDELPAQVRDREGVVPALDDVRTYQASLASYEGFLHGGERVESLDGLRSWIAYPPTVDSVVRPYLAVRDVRILCPFPRAAVRSLGCVDLPGLGEVLPDAEERHLRGLQDEADYVLLVLRPGERGFWNKGAEQAKHLIDLAKGPAQSLRAFAGVLVNSGSTPPAQRDSLVQSILAKANEGVPDKNMRTFESDACDPERVHADVLVPVLDHLAESLPEMDRQHVAAAHAQVRLLHDRARHDLAAIERAIREWAVSAPNTWERFDELVAALRSGLAAELRLLITRYQAASATGAVDDAFLASVEGSYARLLAWAEGSFGRGDEAWTAAAAAEVASEGNAAGFATRELNALRNRIAQEFGDLDAVCQDHVGRLHGQVAELLAAAFGDLLPGPANTPDTPDTPDTADLASAALPRGGGDEAGSVSDMGSPGGALLAELARLAADAYEPCELLPAVLRRLDDLRLDYSTLILPRVRRQLDLLDSQQLLVTGELATPDLDQLLVTMRQLAEKAAWEVKKALLAESITPTLATLVALEQFEDAFIRSAGAEKELRRIARSYRDEIWPGAFAGPNAISGRLTALRRSLHDLLDELAAAADDDTDDTSRGDGD